MNEVLVRLLLLGGLGLVAVGVGLAARRWSRPTHRPVDVAGLADHPGVVLFTFTGCRTCKEALTRVEELGAPLREVTWELEARVFDDLGVEAVPLTVVVDRRGRTVAVLAGVPGRRRLRRAWRRATRVLGSDDRAL